MASEEKTSMAGLGIMNGDSSTESTGYVASSHAQSRDQASVDSSASLNRGGLTSNGIESPEKPNRVLQEERSKQRSSHTQLNGNLAMAASQGENGHAEEDLWSSILNSVKSSRAVPVKNIVMLGESRTGKSTLLRQMASLSPSSSLSMQDTSFGDTSFAEGSGLESVGNLAELGLGYSYFDVVDEDGEEVVARVGVYQISSSNSAHLSLLPFALTAPADGLTSRAAHTLDNHASGSRSLKINGEGEGGVNHLDTKPRPSIEALRDSLFLITLDWEAPWTFLSQLIEWLDVVREIVEDGAGANRGNWSRERVIWDEMKESLEASIRAYADPSGPAGAAMEAGGDDDDVGNTSTASAILAVTNPAAMGGDEVSPLPEGCLSHNFGVPLVIVCTKADTIAQLERERNFKEEQFDYIQQVLRTICLKYGAGLFFTAQSKLPSFEILRSYILNQLFSHRGHGTSNGVFAFPHRASTVERDVLLVPAGWDSFGKIRALRDGFDCAGMANGWEWDAQVERIRRSRSLPKGSKEAEEIAEQQIERRMLPGLIDGDKSGVESAIKLFEDIIEDWDASAPPQPLNSSRVKEPDDQAFLLQHYSSMQREPETKGKLSRQGSSSQVQSTPIASSARSVVGPMGSSSLSLPSVERAMQERQLSDEGRSSNSKSSSRKEGQGGGRDRDREREREGGRSTPSHRNIVNVNSSALQSPSLSSSDKGGNSRPTSPAGLQTPKQSEVLHSFFQSLLKEKGTGSATGSGRSSASRSNATGERKSAS